MTIYSDYGSEPPAIAKSKDQERIEELKNALAGLLGLIQLVSKRDDLPVGLDDLMLLNHRTVEARRALEEE